MTVPGAMGLSQVEKIETGIPGFEFVSDGGLPRGRTTLVAGAPGTGKTIFAAQFLAEGISRGDNGVFVTFEESPESIRANLAGCGWDVSAWETDGRWRFVDASPESGGEGLETGPYDLGVLTVRIKDAVEQVGASRVAFDSLAALLPRFPDTTAVRLEMFRIATELKRLGVTTVVTGERDETSTEREHFDIEEYVFDAVVLVRNHLEGERRRRTIEVYKMRGTSHRSGEFPFTMVSGSGISIVPLSAVELERLASTRRVSTGIQELDTMVGGGLFEGSVTLISGATGTGKTLLGLQFITDGAKRGEKGAYVAFEEGEGQLSRNAASWGMDLKPLVDSGHLRLVAQYPETATLESHLIHIKNLVEQYRPQRLVLDSLSALERVTGELGFKQFVVALAAYLKDRGVTSVFTAASPGLVGGGSASQSHVSTMTDAIVLMRYVELPGSVGRALTVLKMRGSKQDRSVRRVVIDDNGLQIGEPFSERTGLLGSGRPEESLS